MAISLITEKCVVIAHFRKTLTHVLFFPEMHIKNASKQECLSVEGMASEVKRAFKIEIFFLELALILSNPNPDLQWNTNMSFYCNLTLTLTQLPWSSNLT